MRRKMFSYAVLVLASVLVVFLSVLGVGVGVVASAASVDPSSRGSHELVSHAAIVPAVPAAATDPVDGVVVVMDRPFTYRDLARSAAVSVRDSYSSPGGGAKVSYLELRVSDLCLPKGERLAFYGSDGIVERDSVAGGCHAGGKGGRRHVWTERIEGNEVLIRLVRDSNDSVDDNDGTNEGGLRASEPIAPRLLIDIYVRGHPPIKPNLFTPRTICGPNESRDAICYASSHREEYSRSRSVVRIRVRTTSGVGSWCSGFLISRSNLLLTNEHCVGTDDAASNSDYEFGSENGECDDGTNGRGRHGGYVKVRGGATLLMSSRSKDYALLRLPSDNENDSDPAAEFGYLDLSPSAPFEGDPLYVPHHPDGRAREMSLFSTHALDESGLCEVTKVNCCSVKYYCDTNGGSSGSPVLSRTSHGAVTLHSSGDSGCDSGGNYGRIMGQIYDEIRGTVDECASDDDCVPEDGGGGGGDVDSCVVYECVGTPRRCREGPPREGCCGNGVCEEGENCGSCPLDCCFIHSLETTATTVATRAAAVDDNVKVGHGVMFDIEVAPGASASSVDILELWFVPHYGGYSDISVRVRTGGGTYVGYENSPSEWTRLGSGAGAGASSSSYPVLLEAGVPAAVPASIIGRGRPLVVQSGTRLGIYVSSRASRVELQSTTRGNDSHEVTAATSADGLVMIHAGATAVMGSEIGSLEVIPSDSSSAFAGKIVYRARSSADGEGSMARPDSTGADGAMTLGPTGSPTKDPTQSPSAEPTSAPTNAPTATPASSMPTPPPTPSPTPTPSSSTPTSSPTSAPSSSAPTSSPTFTPSSTPPTSSPAVAPSASVPSSTPTIPPTATPLSSTPNSSSASAPSSSSPMPTPSPTPIIPSFSLTSVPSAEPPPPSSAPTTPSLPTASPSDADDLVAAALGSSSGAAPAVGAKSGRCDNALRLHARAALLLGHLPSALSVLAAAALLMV